MRCAKCEAENREGRKYCAQCGSTLAVRCPRCGVSNEPDEKFCGDCGTALAASAAAASAKKSNDLPIRVADTSAENLEGERKTVTALFADIKGSTELEQDLDPEEARAIVDPALKLMIDAVQRYDGYVVQSTGDGIFAIFGAPVAHEDHPQRALYAATRMQDHIRRYADRLRAEGRAPLQIRIGANTGEVVVRSIATGRGQVEYTPIGHTANLASRMQSLANPGSTVIAETTRKLVEGYFALKPLGPARIKGVSEPVVVYEVTGLGPLRTHFQRAAGRGLTKFVGREREMEALAHAAERAKAGRGQIVAAMAEPGVGKSRLFYEFKAKHLSGWMVLEAFSVSHGKASAYLPVIDLLHGYFKILGEDDPRTRREKVNGRVVTLDPALEDTRPYLFGLLGLVEGEDPLAQMDGHIRKRRTLEAIKRIVLRESLNQPLMVMFEDLHWIDEQTQEFLNLLADSIGTAKILLLVNYRPEYSHQWNNKTYYTQLRLDPLGRESAAEMLDALLGSSAPAARSAAGDVPSASQVRSVAAERPSAPLGGFSTGEAPSAPLSRFSAAEGQGEGSDLFALKRLIIDKTEGTPFFMEEMVQALLDGGALVRNGVTHLTKPLAELKIPPTVQAILASRIDRLPPSEKELLQALAVIGREFPLSVVRGVVKKSDDELNRMLNDLQLGEFIYEQPAVGDTEYIFKHALTQEVAYNSVLSERRKLLHERVGVALESLYAGSLDDHLSELAHHYGRGANIGKAVDYLARAARQAESRSAYGEVIALTQAGIAMIPALPPGAERGKREFDLLLLLVRATMVIEGWGSPQAEQGNRRMLELARESGDDRALFAALSGLWFVHMIAARYEQSMETARQMLEVAERRQTPALLADAHHARAVTLFWTGHIGEALAESNQAIALCSDGAGRITVEGTDPLAWSLQCQSWSSWCAGYPDRAVKPMESAFRRSRDLKQPYVLANVLFFEAFLRVCRREVVEVRRACDRLEALAELGGFASYSALNRIAQGWVASMQGKHERAVTAIRSGITQWANPIGSVWFGALLAEACARAGRRQEAIDVVAADREHAARTGEHFYEPELERLAGEVLMLMGEENAAEAERCMRRATAIAVEQGAKSLELRAAISLARLLRDTDRRDEARTMLAEIYGWFTEGFETADLKDARALLDELSA